MSNLPIGFANHFQSEVHGTTLTPDGAITMVPGWSVAQSADRYRGDDPFSPECVALLPGLLRLRFGASAVFPVNSD
jgi:hypothetical protein